MTGENGSGSELVFQEAVSRGSSTTRSYIRRLRWPHATPPTSSANSSSDPDSHPGAWSTQQATPSQILTNDENSSSTAESSGARRVGCQARDGSVTERQGTAAPGVSVGDDRW